MKAREKENHDGQIKLKQEIALSGLSCTLIALRFVREKEP